MLNVSPGHSPGYYLSQIVTGRESYYTCAVTEGEPPGAGTAPAPNTSA